MPSVVLLYEQVLVPGAHELVLAALPAVEELRSTTARMALLLFQVHGFVSSRSSAAVSPAVIAPDSMEELPGAPV